MDRPAFKTDENVHPDVAGLLQASGYDARTVWDQSLRGIEDANLLLVCIRERRVLVTCDIDFCDIRRYPPSEHCGIVVLRTSDQSRKGAVDATRRVISALSHAQIAQTLWIVDDKRIRRRV